MIEVRPIPFTDRGVTGGRSVNGGLEGEVKSLELVGMRRDGVFFVDMTRHAPGISARKHKEDKVPSAHA